MVVLAGLQGYPMYYVEYQGSRVWTWLCGLWQLLGLRHGRWDPAFAWKEDCYNSESYMHAASSSNESRLLLDSGRIEESPFATLMLLFFLSWVSTCDLKFWCSIGVSSQPPRVGWWSAAAALISASASGRRRCIRTAIQYYHFRFSVLVPSFSPGVYILVLLSCRMPLAAAIPWLYNTPSWPRSIYMVLDTRERDREMEGRSGTLSDEISQLGLGGLAWPGFDHVVPSCHVRTAPLLIDNPSNHVVMNAKQMKNQN